ncbi:hypothetical protein PENSPDRAFT_702426 [Peniophora sp. CONT]|nr:hypothetical protein PENSPDRAFT_702426 [Peniophora sp. CONT]
MSTPSFGYSEPQNRSRSVSRSSTDSVLSMSSFGVSLSSAAQAKSPEAEASSSETASGPPAVASPHGIYTQSSRFFMTDKVVRFLVADDVLFQVHSSVLEHHSGWFRAQLALPEDALPPGWHEARDVPGAPPGLGIFAHSESGMVSCSRPTSKDPVSDAIVLDDISVDEFEAFLSVLYPKDFTTFDLDATSDRDWTAVLKIAHRWDCPTIKALAVERLDIILTESPDDTCFKRLSLARTYNVAAWLVQAISGLCARRGTLVEEEIAQMRPADVQCVMEAREAELRESVARATREEQTSGAKAPAHKTSSSLEVEDEPDKTSGTTEIAQHEAITVPASQNDDSDSATAFSKR